MTTFTDTIHKVTSFALLTLNIGRIKQIVDDTGRTYLECPVIHTLPNGSTRSAVIKEIELCSSCGLTGDFLIFIEYTDNEYRTTETGKQVLLTAPSAWVTRNELTVA